MAKKPKLYVAGKYGSLDCKETTKDLKGKGYKLTLNWLALDVKLPYKDNAKHNSKHAESMVEAVKSADALVLIGDPKLHGALVELGVALGNNVPVYLLHKRKMHDSVFLCHEGVKAVTYAQLLEELKNLD